MEDLKIIKNNRLHTLSNAYVGKFFGKLMIVSILGTKKNRTFVRFLCDCGNFKEGFLYHILRKHTKSCGCINGNTRGNIKHGEARRGQDTAEYRAWLRMKTTTLSGSEKIRGKYKLDPNKIKICERWLDKKDGYKNFIEDIGRRPDLRYKFFRLDKAKGFNKENCAWVMKNKNIEVKRRMSDVDGHYLNAMDMGKVVKDFNEKIRKIRQSLLSGNPVEIIPSR